MEILGYIIYGLGALLAFIWMLGIRSNTHSGKSIAMSTVNTTMLFIVSLIIVQVLTISPFHLLWMYPLSIGIGLLSLSPPLSILSVPGHIIFWIACLGLNQQEVLKNKERVSRGIELMQKEGLSVEEAKERLKEEGF